MQIFLFYLFSAMAIVGALSVVLLPKPNRALLSLIVTMVALTGLYVMLGAHFVAIAQIIVYAGAVLVLFLFVIMLQGIEARDIAFGERFRTSWLVLFIAAAVSFLGVIGAIFKHSHMPAWKSISGTVEAVGTALFTRFMLPFELTAVLLLLSVFAAVALAKNEESK